jgi:hypothetical protein
MIRLEPLYRATFTTPEKWSVNLAGPAGTEGQSFLIAEGHCEGRLSGRLRGANYPRRRTDNALLPDFRGVLQTSDGAVCSSRGTDTPGRAQVECASW